MGSYPLDSGRRPQSRVGQTISFCGLSGTGSAPALTDDKKRSSVPQSRCHSGYLSQADSPMLVNGAEAVGAETASDEHHCVELTAAGCKVVIGKLLSRHRSEE